MQLPHVSCGGQPLGPPSAGEGWAPEERGTASVLFSRPQTPLDGGREEGGWGGREGRNDGGGEGGGGAGVTWLITPLHSLSPGSQEWLG